MKIFPTATVFLVAGLALPLSSCKPQAPDMERLTALQKSNEQLREEIGHMQALIRQAGADTPRLQEHIAERSQEVESALRRRTSLRQQETDLKLRYIELESRLKSFRNTFEEMKNSVANQSNSF